MPPLSFVSGYGAGFGDSPASGGTPAIRSSPAISSVAGISCQMLRLSSA